MNEEERLTLNTYIDNLYQAMLIGDIVFEPKHSSELYDLINKLLEENQTLKQKLEQRDNIINKIIEIKYNFQNENSLLIFENENLLKFMNDLQDVFNLKIRSDK